MMSVEFWFLLGAALVFWMRTLPPLWKSMELLPLERRSSP